MAAGDDHRRAVAGADVRQSQDDVALAAAEDAVLIQIASPEGAPVAAGVDRVVPAGASNRGDAFVDEQPLDVRLLLAAVVAYVVNPARMVNQPLERLAHFYAVVQLEAGFIGIVTALGIAPPLAP